MFKKRDGVVEDSLYCQKRNLCYKLNSPCVYYLRTQNPYKEKSEKLLSSKCCQFVNKLYSRYQISSCECSMCLHCVYKVSDVTVKALVQVYSPCMRYLRNKKKLMKKKISKRCHYIRLFSRYQISSCKSPMCRHCAYKVSDCS